MDLTAKATEASRRSRLVEQVLLDAVQERAAAECKRGDPKAAPPAAVVWAQDAPPGGALIGGRPVSGRVGELHLLDAGAAAVLKDSGYVEVRESLSLPAWRRPEVAGELREVAAELQAAADALDPPATPQPARQAKNKQDV
jgi:hypothetical protein